MIERYRVQTERYQEEYNRSWEQTRQIWALIANVNRDAKKHSSPYSGTDLIKLSYDTQDKTLPKQMTEKEMKQMFGSKFKKNGSE